MSQELRRHADQHIGHIPQRKLREHAAEVDLVLRFLGAEPGYFVEVGANDPELYSQTYEMEQRGWRGLLVEPIPEFCDRLRAERPGSVVAETACASPERVGTATFHVAPDGLMSTLDPEALQHGVETVEITVNVTTLDAVLDEHADAPIDFVSIDVEGSQLDVARRVRPAPPPAAPAPDRGPPAGPADPPRDHPRGLPPGQTHRAQQLVHPRRRALRHEHARRTLGAAPQALPGHNVPPPPPRTAPPAGPVSPARKKQPRRIVRRGCW